MKFLKRLMNGIIKITSSIGLAPLIWTLAVVFNAFLITARFPLAGSCLAETAASILQAEYVPQPLRSIRVPKTSYTTRPGAVPDLFDRIYYQYLVDEIADEIEDNLIPISENVVHSYRYIKKRDAANMFLKSQANYSTFEQRTMELAEEHKFIVVTDISSYFERIYHVVTPQVVGYLNTIYQNDDIFVKMEVSSRLSETFKDELWSYDWQIMWYLHLMNKFNDLESDEVNAVRSLLINRTRELHDAVLVNGLLFLGKHGDNADLEWILVLFDNYSLWVKNAIIFSLRNLTKTKRNHFYSYCVGQNLLIDKIIEYVKLKY